MNRILLALLGFSVLFLASCTSVTPPPVAVQDIPFPGGEGTSLPSLSSDGKTLILSWVATPTDSTAQFHFARLGEDVLGGSDEHCGEQRGQSERGQRRGQGSGEQHQAEENHTGHQQHRRGNQRGNAPS